MEGTLVVNEERGKINKFQQWYQEKLVDTNISQKSEKVISGVSKFTGGAHKFIYDAAGAVCLFIPGAQIAAPICTFGGKLYSKFFEFSGNAVVGAKRFVEGKIIGVDGSSKDVVIPKLDAAKVTDEVKNVVSETATIVSEAESGGKTL